MGSTRVAALCVAFWISGCANAPKPVAFDATSHIRKVIVVEYPEPQQYRVVGTQAIPTAGGVAMMVLGGAIGGAIVGGIEASHQADEAKSLTAAIRSGSPGFAARLYSRLEAKLRERGYDVLHIERPLKKSPDEVVDYTPVAGGAEAVIEASPTLWGYRKIDAGFEPMMGVRVRMVGPSGAPVRYAQVFQYGSGKSEGVVYISPDARFVIPDSARLFSSGATQSEALEAGADQIAAHIAADL